VEVWFDDLLFMIRDKTTFEPGEDGGHYLVCDEGILFETLEDMEREFGPPPWRPRIIVHLNILRYFRKFSQAIAFDLFCHWGWCGFHSLRDSMIFQEETQNKRNPCNRYTGLES